MSLDQALSAVKKMRFGSRRVFFQELERLARSRSSIEYDIAWPDLLLFIVPADIQAALKKASGGSE